MTPSASPHLGDILNRLDGVKQSGKGYVALCPAHEDRHHSLSISEDRGKILLHCHTGCTPQAIVGALGLPMTALFQDKTKASGNGHKATTETTWQIKDASGKVVAEHVRLDHADGCKSFVWRRGGKTGLNGTKTEALPLYGLPLLLESPSGVHVVVTEGEKAADSLQRRGFVAVGTVTGAAGCPDEDALKPVANHNGTVCLWPDNDDVGRAHMERIASRLVGMGNRVSMITWPDAPLHGDAADYKGDIQILLDAAQPWRPAEPKNLTMPTIPDGAISKEIPLGDGNSITLIAENIRYERTGAHARLAVYLNDKSLAYDSFNLGKDAERTRLANSAAAQLPTDTAKTFDKKAMKVAIDSFCSSLYEDYIGGLVGGLMAGSLGSKPTWYWKNVIPKDGGALLVSPPGMGKTNIAICGAQSMNKGINTVFDVEQATVLYVNLERSQRSMEWRLARANLSLGLPAHEPMLFFNARGRSLLDVADAVRATIKKYGVQVLFLDSISRAGQGDLKEDSTANRIVDTLNNLCPTWLAIAHTPRADDSHIYGSVHFEAGADLVVVMNSQKKPGLLGISLQATKANDFEIPQPARYALEFDQDGLTRIRKAGRYEFGELELKRQKSMLEEVKDYLLSEDQASATAIADAIGYSRQKVATLLANDDTFVKLGKSGKETLYGVASHV